MCMDTDAIMTHVHLPYVVLSECNVCYNGGTCRQHVTDVTCECPSGFAGYFCENKGKLSGK